MSSGSTDNFAESRRSLGTNSLKSSDNTEERHIDENSIIERMTNSSMDDKIYNDEEENETEPIVKQSASENDVNEEVNDDIFTKGFRSLFTFTRSKFVDEKETDVKEDEHITSINKTPIIEEEQNQMHSNQENWYQQRPNTEQSNQHTQNQQQPKQQSQNKQSQNKQKSKGQHSNDQQLDRQQPNDQQPNDQQPSHQQPSHQQPSHHQSSYQQSSGKQPAPQPQNHHQLNEEQLHQEQLTQELLNRTLKATKQVTETINSHGDMNAKYIRKTTKDIKTTNQTLHASHAEGTSRGFLSPPAFHLTQVIHDERCFKKTYGHVTVEINGDICIFGGIVEGKYVNNFIRYIPGINVFENFRIKSGSIEPRAHCSGNVITELISTAVTATRVDNNSAKEQTFKEQNKTQVNGTEHKDHPQSENVNNKKKCIIIFGGINKTNEVLDETYKFDFLTKRWIYVRIKICPPARYCHASFSSDDTVYIHGGLDKNDYLLSDFWRFHNNAWNLVPVPGNMPSARYGHSLVYFHNENVQRAFLFGGNTKGINGAVADTWMFNLRTNEWRLMNRHSGKTPCARWGHSAQIFDKKWMIVYGGFANGWIDSYALADMYALDIFTFCWFEIEISTSYNFNRGYYGSLCVLSYKKSLFVFGGYDNKSGYSNVFSITPIVTYVTYKLLINEIEFLNNKVKGLTAISDENNEVDLLEVGNKINDLKQDMANINSIMSTFESKIYKLELLNEQCEKLLSKDVSSDALEKLTDRIKKLEICNSLLKYKINKSLSASASSILKNEPSIDV